MLKLEVGILRLGRIELWGAPRRFRRATLALQRMVQAGLVDGFAHSNASSPRLMLRGNLARMAPDVEWPPLCSRRPTGSRARAFDTWRQPNKRFAKAGGAQRHLIARPGTL